MATAVTGAKLLLLDSFWIASINKSKAVPLLMPAVTGIGIILNKFPNLSSPHSSTKPLATRNIRLPAANPSLSCAVVRLSCGAWPKVPSAVIVRLITSQIYAAREARRAPGMTAD